MSGNSPITATVKLILESMYSGFVTVAVPLTVQPLLFDKVRDSGRGQKRPSIKHGYRYACEQIQPGGGRFEALNEK